MYNQNVTTTAIGLQSTLNTQQALWLFVFLVWLPSLAKVNKSSGAHFEALFSKIILFDYIKDRWRAIYFNKQKNHCISPL